MFFIQKLTTFGILYKKNIPLVLWRVLVNISPTDFSFLDTARSKSKFEKEEELINIESEKL